MHQGPVPLFVLVRMNQNVVHVYCDPTFLEFLGKDGVHYGLEGGQRVGKAKKHHSWFE